MISQWYDPEVGSAAIFGLIARTLASRGHEVVVLTGFPNYPSGAIYPGYRQSLHKWEILDGLSVHRAPLYARHDKNAVGRMLNYLSFAVSSTVIGLSVLKDVDAVLACSGPVTAAIPAIALRTIRGIPHVLLIEDMWPQSVTASGFLTVSANAKVERALHILCDAAYRSASRIAVTSPGMTSLIADRGIPRMKISLVPNWADEMHFRPVPRSTGLVDELGPFRKFTLMYAGNLGEVQDLHTIIEAACLLRGRPDIGFIFVGGGVAEAALRGQVHDLNLDNVRFIRSQPLERMSDIMALADVQLISLRDIPVFQSTLPSKVQATLAAGRPILGVVAGDAATIIMTSGAGETVSPGSAQALADAVVRMSNLSQDELDQLGQRGRDFYEMELAREMGGARLEALLISAAASATLSKSSRLSRFRRRRHDR